MASSRQLSVSIFIMGLYYTHMSSIAGRLAKPGTSPLERALLNQTCLKIDQQTVEEENHNHPTGSEIKFCSDPPGSLILKAGEKLSFLCDLGVPLLYCRIVPPEADGRILSDDRKPRNSTYRYYGDSLEKGHCGITIDHLEEDNHNGTFQCAMTKKNGHREIIKYIQVIVARAPKSIEMTVTPEAYYFQEDFDKRVYIENGTIVATCVVRDARPAANITWYINDKMVLNGTLVTSETSESNGFFTVKQNLNYELTWKDDKISLTCEGSHLASDTPLRKSQEIFLWYSPLPNYKVTRNEYSLTISIQANPRPNIIWNVDGKNISEGGQDHSYEVSELINLENNLWQTSLIIIDSNDVHTEDIKYQLFVRNIVGERAYEIPWRIQSEKHPEQVPIMLGNEAVITVVVAVLLILVLIMFIIYFRMTHRWCFSDAHVK